MLSVQFSRQPFSSHPLPSGACWHDQGLTKGLHGATHTVAVGNGNRARWRHRLLGPPTPTPASGCRQLDAFLKWHHGVREFLQSAIDANSRCTGTADGSARKVAIFDWDNTVVKNDIGYATNYYMLQHSLVLQPANQDWHAASRYLTDAAANALSVACGKVVPAGKPLPTGSNALCANEILSLLDGETTTGQPAFVGNNVRRLAGPYAWSNALSAGYTAEELAGFADQARNRTLPPMSAPPSRSEHSRSMVTSASIHK